MHVAAESWAGSRSWQAEDRDKSLIYWVHFLLSQPPLPMYREREKGKKEVNRERRVVKNKK